MYNNGNLVKPETGPKYKSVISGEEDCIIAQSDRILMIRNQTTTDTASLRKKKIKKIDLFTESVTKVKNHDDQT